MSIMAGIYSRSTDYVIGDDEFNEINRLISRNPNEQSVIYRNRNLAVIKVGIGAYKDEGGFIQENGTMSVITGEPLLDLCGGGIRSRDDELKILHQSLRTGRWDILSNVNGVFCSVHYSSLTNCLFLISDKLCIRPMYYCIGERYIIFGSALRILEGCKLISKVMDIRGVVEILALDYPLSVRTAYKNISLMRAGEIVKFNGQSVSSKRYLRLDKGERSEEAGDELLNEVYGLFRSAIRRRNREDKETNAFLSGGLDSRCVVTELHFQNVRIHTYNFSDPNSQDRIFSKGFADKLGLDHMQRPMLRDQGWSMMIANAIRESERENVLGREREGIVWSGDGGSVGLGHVYITEDMVDLLRSRKCEQAIKEFIRLQGAAVVKGLLRKDVIDKIDEIPFVGIMEELKEFKFEDPAKGFYIFLMHNDQRRHLARHFEDMDLHRIELQVPFFDSGFLEVILRSPIDIFLRHKFYSKWISRFPSVLTSVPWQTYPGHEPCPISVPRNLGYQWSLEELRKVQKMYKSKLLEDINTLLGTKDFPGDILDKKRLQMARIMYLSGVRDYSYVLNYAITIWKYWKASNGKSAF